MKGVLSFILGLFLGGFSFLSAQEIWINCGGQAYNDHFGRPFLADVEYSADQGYGYVGGKDASWTYSTSDIPERYDRELLHTRRHGEFEYRFDGSSEKYILTLYFCDHLSRFPGSFPFNVTVEDSILLEDYSIFSDAGRLHLSVRRFLIEVQDSQMNVQFDPLYWGHPWPTAQIVAIGIIPYDTSIIPHPPEEFEIIESYGVNALVWTHNRESGFNVYRSDGTGFLKINDSIIHSSRYYDRNVVSGVNYRYYLTSVEVCGNESNPTKILSGTPLNLAESNLPSYSISIEENLYDSMWFHMSSDTYTSCFFSSNMQACSAGVRFRGNHELKIGTKVAWKIRFPDEHPEIGEKKLNLKSENSDPSLIREGLFFSFSDDMGLPTISRWFVNLTVNGEYRGVFLQKEQVEENFLERRGLNPDGSTYKVWYGRLIPLQDDSLYRKGYYKETGDLDDYSDLIDFITLVDTTSNHNLAEVLSNNLDLCNFASWYGLNNVVGAIDYHCLNHYLYRGGDNRWKFIAWDSDLTFVTSSGWDWRVRRSIETFSTGSSANPLFTRFLSVPSFKMAYCNRVYQFLSMNFTPERLGERIDSLYSLIEDEGKADYWKTYGEITSIFQSQPDSIFRWCCQRREYLLTEGVEKSMPPRSSGVRINEVATQPQSWVEIVNSGFYEVDLSGYSLGVKLAETGRWHLPDMTLEPGEVIILLENENKIPHLDPLGGELIIFDRSDDPVDAIFYDYLAPGSSLSREGRGSDIWKILDKPTPGEITRIESEQNIEVLPNPISDQATISVRMNYPADYTLSIYDPAGRRVGIIDRSKPHSITDSFQWDGIDQFGNQLPEGIYFLRATSLAETIGVARIVLIK